MSLGNPDRLRTDLRLSAADTDDAGAERPLLACIRYHRSRSRDDVAFAARCRPIVTASATGARVSSLPPGGCGSRAQAWSGIPGIPISLHPSRTNIRSRSCPRSALVFLLGSRYCDTEKLSETAWSLFAKAPMGWGRVQAICDFVHNHISFGYEHARATRTAWEAFNERRGVCRDYAHLAVAFCRCLNIPARYCTGYLGDIGMPPPYGPMDFAAWFEAYLGGRWYTFDARNNMPRIGRVLMARGRDAIDVAIATTFGPNTLVSFKVWTDETTS